MMDQNTIDNQAKLRGEIKEIKEYISLLEHEANSSGHVERLSDNQFQLIFGKLQAATNCVCNAGYYWAVFTNDKELKRKLVDLDLKITHEQLGGSNK